MTSRAREARFQSFCGKWFPPGGLIERAWGKHRCEVGYARGGYRAATDGTEVGVLSHGADAMRAAFVVAGAAVHEADPAEVEVPAIA